MKFLKILLCAYLIMVIGHFPLMASEVLDPTQTQAMVRTHPKTGKPYVSIVPSREPVPGDPFEGLKRYSRPDYRMLDPKVKKGQVFYDGPVSDRRKVYAFAATLMTVGTVGGAVGIAAAPVAAATTAGSGAYLAGGSVLAGTATAAAVLSTKPRPGDDDYKHISESRENEIENSTQEIRIKPEPSED